eukprot:gene45286-57681_t
MGVACHAALRGMLQYRAEQIRAMRVRFTGVVLPGDTIRTELWMEGDVISFRATALERNVVVLNAGKITLTADNAATH